MDKNLCEFIGINCSEETEADRKISEIVEHIFTTVEYMKVVNRNDFVNLEQMIGSMLTLNNKHTYFWEWMYVKGFNYIKNALQSSLHDNEVVLDLLDYRIELLRLDAESGIPHNYFISAADTMLILNVELATQYNSEDKISLENRGV